MSHGRANSEMRQVMVAEGCPLTSHLREKTDKDFQFVATSSGVLTSCLTNPGRCNSGHFFITSFVVIQWYINRFFWSNQEIYSLELVLQHSSNPPLELVEKWVAVQSSILFILVGSIKKVTVSIQEKLVLILPLFLHLCLSQRRFIVKPSRTQARGARPDKSFGGSAFTGFAWAASPPHWWRKTHEYQIFVRETANFSFLCEWRNQRPFTVPPKVEESVVIGHFFATLW